MPRDQVTVAGRDEIRLDVVGAHLDRERVRRERVLRPIARCAAMRDDERRLAVERAPGAECLPGDAASTADIIAERERREQQHVRCIVYLPRTARGSVDEEIRQEIPIAGRHRVLIQVVHAGAREHFVVDEEVARAARASRASGSRARRPP